MTRPGRSSSPHVLPVTSTVAAAAADPEPAVSVPPAEGPAAPELPAARSVWQNREFRAVWVAFVLSLAGDQLARVALTVLLYAATGSAVWAASGGVVSLLGPIVGGPLLGGLADRYSRRAVMIGCDLASAGLIAAMAVSGLPLVAMVVLLLAASVLIGPFTAARSALIRDVFPDDGAYARAIGVNGSTFRFALTVGLIGGGGVVATLGARPALLADAATFLLSALLLRCWVRDRPAAAARPHGSGHSGLAAARLIAGDPVLRTCTLYGWLAAAYVVPFRRRCSVRGRARRRGLDHRSAAGCSRRRRRPGNLDLDDPGAAGGAGPVPRAWLAAGLRAPDADEFHPAGTGGGPALGVVGRRRRVPDHRQRAFPAGRPQRPPGRRIRDRQRWPARRSGVGHAGRCGAERAARHRAHRRRLRRRRYGRRSPPCPGRSAAQRRNVGTNRVKPAHERRGGSDVQGAGHCVEEVDGQHADGLRLARSNAQVAVQADPSPPGQLVRGDPGWSASPASHESRGGRLCPGPVPPAVFWPLVSTPAMRELRISITFDPAARPGRLRPVRFRAVGRPLRGRTTIVRHATIDLNEDGSGTPILASYPARHGYRWDWNQPTLTMATRWADT